MGRSVGSDGLFGSGSNGWIAGIRVNSRPCGSRFSGRAQHAGLARGGRCLINPRARYTRFTLQSNR